MTTSDDPSDGASEEPIQPSFPAADMLDFEETPALQVRMPTPYVPQPPRAANEWWWLRRMSWEALMRRTEDLKNPPSSADSWFFGLFGVTASFVAAFLTELVSAFSTLHDARPVVLVLFGCASAFSGLGMLLTKTIKSEGSQTFDDQKRMLLREMTEMEKHFREVEPVPDEGTLRK